MTPVLGLCEVYKLSFWGLVLTIYTCFFKVLYTSFFYIIYIANVFSKKVNICITLLKCGQMFSLPQSMYKTEVGRVKVNRTNVN